jgi:error-prone DNA polymerase
VTGAPAYAELHCHSYFSLLDGASSPEALVDQAVALGLHSLALTDHDSLAGAVRFWKAAQRAGLPAVIGAEVTLEDGAHITLLAETQAGYANLCRLITASRQTTAGTKGNLTPRRQDAEGQDAKTQDGSNRNPQDAITTDGTGLTPRRQDAKEGQAGETPWTGKVAAALSWDALAALCAGLIALTGCRRGAVAAALLRQDAAGADKAAGRLADIFGAGSVFVELQHHDLPDDDRLVRGLLALGKRTGLPVVATQNVHYATPEVSRLRDVFIAVRQNCTLAETQRAGHLPLNSSYALASPAAMGRRFAQRPDALANTIVIAERCQVSLDFSAVRLPISNLQSPSLSISQSPFHTLYELCHANLPRCYPALQPAVLTQLAHELAVIEAAGLAGYFLVVWDIVRFAWAQGIRCQGRGSAANSIVAYLLGVTSIDPLAHNLLFERFLSSDKFTMPDIDIDFAADRREEVIQYVYQRYGHDHAGMVCNVVTYQARSALRDLGKALELPGALVEKLQRELDTHSPTAAAEKLEELLMVNGQWSMVNEESAGAAVPHSPFPIPHLPFLLRQIDGCPRHLSIHSGGMIITAAPLAEIVPLEPATMPGRYVCQWDKESVEDAGLVKIDLLALRTLGAITEALGHIAGMGRPVPDLDRIPLDDPDIYRMLQQGDTTGAFQVESRAQQQMLPRLQPTCFEDIVVEVAIVRPGPIQGGAVHPYLRRRAGQEPVSYLHPSLEPVLKETLGVLLFQEQAIRISMVVAGFPPGAADMLRRALSRSRAEAEMAVLQQKFVAGAVERGIDAAAAATIFAQLAGFAGYGFCKSHAASFALIAYQTLWLKHYHAPAFYCALLNQQPMGFYPPEVIIGDARRHNVETLPPDVNRSEWRYTLERTAPGRWALRTGLHAVSGVGEQAWGRIVEARCAGSFANLEDFCRRARLHRDVVENLIRAGACDGFGQRRELLWTCAALDYRPDELDLPGVNIAAALPPLDGIEATAWEYELMGLSPRQQMMVHYRQALRAAGVLTTGAVKQEEAGRRVRVAGFAVVRQRPATAKGIVFYSLEDESGLLDLVVKPDVYARLRRVLSGHPLLLVRGVVQRSGRAVSVLVWEAEGLTH